MFFRKNQYGIPCEDPVKEGETLTYRNIRCYDVNYGQLVGSFPSFSTLYTLPEIFLEVSKFFQSRNAICYYQKDGSMNKYLSYKEINHLVFRIASGLCELGLKPLEFVPLYSENSLWFTIGLWTISYCGSVSVPLSPGTTLLDKIIEKYKCKYIICSSTTLDSTLTTLSSLKDNSVQTVIVCGIDDELLERKNSDQISLYTISSIVQIGKRSNHRPRIPLATSPAVLQTYGELDKSILFTHSSVISSSAGLHACGHSFDTDNYISILSMSNPLERSLQLAVMVGGGCICFPPLAGGTLFDTFFSFSTLKPSILLLDSKKLEKIAVFFENEVKDSPFLQRLLFDLSIQILHQTSLADTDPPWLIKAMLHAGFGKRFGGELKIIFVCGGRLKPRTHLLIKELAMTSIVSTLTIPQMHGACCIQHIKDVSFDTNGAPSLSVEIRLKDIPNSQKNTSSDSIGEILIRGPGINVDSTNQSNEWLATGIAAKLSSNGTLSALGSIYTFAHDYIESDTSDE